MNSTNINDTAGVKALLERLRASQAWQETVNPADPTSVSTTSTSTPNAVTPPLHGSGVSTSKNADADSEMPITTSSQPLPVIPPSTSAATVTGSPTVTSVASLLSQLKSSKWTPPASALFLENAPSASSTPNGRSSRSYPQPSFPGSTLSRPVELKQPLPPSQSTNLSQPLATTSAPDEDVRFVTFQQALPRLTQLASNPGFIAAVARLRDEQKDLERQLWEERCEIRRKHEEKVKVARTKANMIGAELSKHEVDTFNNAFRRATQKFDTERVLLAWDALMEKQQTALEALGVPTMFRTSSKEGYEKQKKVTQVLEGLIG